MGPLTTPKKGREVGSVDPWTPTSNLKMLISAASPDIRNREKELGLDVDRPECVDAAQDTETGEDAERWISRKEKSLGLLCQKFLARYPNYPNPAKNNDICLDDVATELNVERRRIYDIMNVLESLHIVSRSAKNRYAWHGRTKLAETLAILKKVGEEHRYSQQMQQIRQRLLEEERDFEEEEEEEKENREQEVEDREQGHKELFFVELPGVEFKAASVNSRKDKSLRVMSQKFVMLFLVSDPRVVSLDVAAKILIGEDHGADQDKSKFKTKVRRLYDIANVLQSLKLIEKVHVTEEGGRKSAFEWVGPKDLPPVKAADLKGSTSDRPPRAKAVLEPRANVENCAKKLFSSKRGFTRHPSLIKLAKSIQEDRRKISSAPSSPLKGPLGDPSGSDFPNKMAQLAAICQIQLDQEEATDRGAQKPAAVNPDRVSGPEEPAQTLLLSPPPTDPSVAAAAHRTPLAVLPGSVAYIPAHCPSLIPVLLPQQQGGAPYAFYLQSPSPKHTPLARPQPTSFAVRSMTFEEKTGQSLGPGPGVVQAGRRADISPLGQKRMGSDSTCEGSPPKARRQGSTSQDSPPRLSAVLQARLRSCRGAQLSSRALHLDPEFINTPGGAGANQVLEQSLESFLEREDKGGSDGELGLTPVRVVPLTPARIQAEALVPAGFYIPIPHPAVSPKEVQDLGKENKASTPTYIYHTPSAGSRPPPAQEITPPSIRLLKPTSAAAAAAAASPHRAQQRLHSPSPAILNFTLQNLGLISGSSPGGGLAASQTPERLSPLALQHRGMVFLKPVSPSPLQQAVSGQQVALISVQQPLMTTPKGAALPQPSFFHTPVPLSPLAAVVPASTHMATKTVYIPQRKLHVSTEDP